MNINHVQVLALVTNGDERYFYTRVNYDDYTHINLKINLRDMQALGIAKTLRSDKKVVAWLDTEEGLLWVNNKINNEEK